MSVLEGVCSRVTEEFDVAKCGSTIREVDFTEGRECIIPLEYGPEFEGWVLLF